MALSQVRNHISSPPSPDLHSSDDVALFGLSVGTQFTVTSAHGGLGDTAIWALRVLQPRLVVGAMHWTHVTFPGSQVLFHDYPLAQPSH